MVSLYVFQARTFDSQSARPRLVFTEQTEMNIKDRLGIEIEQLDATLVIIR